MGSEHDGNHEEWKNIFYKSIVLEPIVQFCEVFLIWIVGAIKMWKHEVQLYQSKNRRCLMRRGVWIPYHLDPPEGKGGRGKYVFNFIGYP